MRLDGSLRTLRGAPCPNLAGLFRGARYWQHSEDDLVLIIKHLQSSSSGPLLGGEELGENLGGLQDELEEEREEETHEEQEQELEEEEELEEELKEKLGDVLLAESGENLLEKEVGEELPERAGAGIFHRINLGLPGRLGFASTTVVQV